MSALAIPCSGSDLEKISERISVCQVQPPVGFWDPLGLSSDGDVTTFKRRREVELKHGRRDRVRRNEVCSR